VAIAAPAKSATAARTGGQATLETVQAEVAATAPAVATDLRVNKDTRHRQLDLTDTTKSQMPRNIKPMPCTLVEKPFGRPNWIFEIKWDGYRAIDEVTAEEVRLDSRNLTSLKPQFPA
jgi:ATP-dependent DNA ligase